MRVSCSGAPTFIPICGAVTTMVGHVVGSVSSHLAGDATSSVLSAIASWVASGASWLLERFAVAVQATTSVDLTARWFTSHEAVMASLAAVLAVPLLMGALIQAIVRGSPELVVRAAFVNLPLALLLAGVAVQLAALGLAVTDQMCLMIWRGGGGSLHGAIDHLAQQLARNTVEGSGVPTFVILIVSLLVMVGAVLLWLELLVRAAAIYAAVLFLPLGLASLIWPSVSHVARRMVTTLVGLVLSKFVIVAILTLAVGAVDQGSAGSGGLSTELAGAALLLLTAFAPFVMIRLVGAADGALALEGARASVHHGAMAVARTAAKGASLAAGGMPLPGMFAGTGATGGFEAAGALAASARGGVEPPGGGGFGNPAGDAARGAPARQGAPGASGSGLATNGASRGVTGGGEVPAWQGDPSSERVFAERTGRSSSPSGPRGPGGGHAEAGRGPGAAVTAAPGTLGGSGSAARRLGGSPIYGVSLTDGDGAPSPEVPLTARPEHHEIGRDDLGPVIRWRPPNGPDEEDARGEDHPPGADGAKAVLASGQHRESGR